MKLITEDVSHRSTMWTTLFEITTSLVLAIYAMEMYNCLKVM